MGKSRGKLSDLENKSRPYTRWHTIWKSKPRLRSDAKALLQIIQKDNPQHTAIKSLLNAYHS